ncbi:hypothetical protein HPP92_007160, partial [Vanilla planifolia]
MRGLSQCLEASSDKGECGEDKNGIMIGIVEKAYRVGKHDQESRSGTSSLIKVDIPEILSVSACADLTLPPGAGLCIDTVQGSCFLADTWESLDGWLDAIRL